MTLKPVVAAKVARMRPAWDHHQAGPLFARCGCAHRRDAGLLHRRARIVAAACCRSRPYRPANFAASGSPAPSRANPPFWITLQCATEMMLADAAFGAVAALVVGDWTWETHIVELVRHQWAEERLRNAVAAFWAAIEAGDMPRINPKRNADLVRLMYPTTKVGKIIDLSRDNRIVELLRPATPSRTRSRRPRPSKRRAETEIRAKMGDAEAAIVPGWKLTLKTTNRKEFVSKATSFRTLRATREHAA